MNIRQAIPPPLLPYWRSMRQKRRARKEVKRAFNSPDGPPILVYQMAKVGSTTVVESLKTVGLDDRVLHVHFLSQELPEKRERYASSIAFPPAYHYDVSREVQRVLARGRRFGLKIVSLVRDPISRWLSSLYQVPELMGHDVRIEGGEIDPQKALNSLDDAANQDKAFEYVFTWFDREVKTVFGIDVFDQPFPKDVGWATYSKNGVDLLLLRLEDLSEIGPNVIPSFLNIDGPLPLIPERVRDNESYETAKKSVSIPRAQAERVYDSDFVRHFYTDAMIEDFLRRWSPSATASTR